MQIQQTELRGLRCMTRVLLKRSETCECLMTVPPQEVLWLRQGRSFYRLTEPHLTWVVFSFTCDNMLQLLVSYSTWIHNYVNNEIFVYQKELTIINEVEKESARTIILLLSLFAEFIKFKCGRVMQIAIHSIYLG